ncbi:unnamed protein product, partial [Closterium sp. NIES-53]
DDQLLIATWYESDPGILRIATSEIFVERKVASGTRSHVRMAGGFGGQTNLTAEAQTNPAAKSRETMTIGTAALAQMLQRLTSLEQQLQTFFELELLLQNAQIFHYFDRSYSGPAEDTADAQAQYYNESLMAYGVLLRNMSPVEQLSIRSYKTTPAPALDAWRHLNGVHQPKDLVSSSRLLQQLLETKMAPWEKANSYLNRCWSLHDQIAKLGSTISEEIFVNIVLQGLGPEWRPCKAPFRQQGVISEAAQCAALLVEQRDMDQQRPAPRRDRERLAFYADNTEERRPRRLYCKICRNFGHLADRCKFRSRPRQTNLSNRSGRQDVRNSMRQAQGHQPPPRNLNPAIQHQQQQSPQTAPIRNVMGNMTMTSGSSRPRARSPSPEPARHPIGAFSNNNLFSTRHNFSNDDKQEWNLLVPLFESPPNIPDQRAAPID